MINKGLIFYRGYNRRESHIEQWRISQGQYPAIPNIFKFKANPGVSFF